MISIMTFGGIAFHSSNLNKQIRFSPKEGELLAMVVTRDSKRLRKERILAELWPNRPDSDARNALNTCLWEINKKLKRQQVAPEVGRLDVTHDAVCYAGDAQVDSLAFSYAVQSFLSASGSQCATPGQNLSASDAVDAITSYKGAFLEGFESGWIEPERAEYEELYCRTCRRCTYLFARQDRIGRAIEFSRRILRIDPYHEGAHLDLVRLLALNGQRASALRHYGQYSDMLKQELGIEPPAEASTLRANIITGDLFDNFSEEVNKVGQPLRSCS